MNVNYCLTTLLLKFWRCFKPVLLHCTNKVYANIVEFATVLLCHKVTFVIFVRLGV